MSKLLVVEDDAEVAGILQEVLVSKGFEVDVAHDTKSAKQFLDGYGYELMILDWQLGADSGATFLKGLRAQGLTTPVIMLTARGDTDSCIFGLEEAGADDYMTKPYSAAELVARIKTIQRRAPKFKDDVLTLGGLSLNRINREISLNSSTVELKKHEAAILELLMKHPDEPFSGDAMLSRLWPSETTVSLENVRVHISNLRAKLKQIGADDYVQTVYGLGYKLNAPKS